MTLNQTPPERPVLAIPENSQVIRVIPDLAHEIGLQKSLALAQVSYWCARTKTFRDGRWWSRCSVRWMQRYAFRFWSLATINRWITRLVADGYIDEDVARSNDQTRWLALNPEGLSKLRSVALVWQDEQGVYRNDTGCIETIRGVSKRYESRISIKESI